MPLHVRLFFLKICQQNRQHHKLISLITTAVQRELSPPPLHFRRFFATKSSPDYEFGTTTKVTTVPGSWRCTNCKRLNWPQHRFCKHCTIGVPTAVQMEELRRLLWTCPNCSYRNNDDRCWRCKVTKCTVYNGNWVCSNCEWRNIPIHPVCPKCKVGKPTQEQLEHVLEQRWICGKYEKCTHTNNYAPVCFICGSSKSEKLLEGSESLSDGSWYCSSCEFRNLPSRLKCRQCKDGVPTEQQRTAILESRWICVECGAYNYKSNSSCHKCDVSRPDDQPISKTDHLGKSLRDGSWYCSNCEYINSPSRLECPNCFVGKPNESQLEQMQLHRWVCGNCRHHNYEDECFKCGVPKATAKMPEAAGGEFLPDASWYCSSCASLNFDTHLVCKQCRIGVPTDEQLTAILDKRAREKEEAEEAKGEQQQQKEEAEEAKGEQQQQKEEAEEAKGEQQQQEKEAEEVKGEQQQEKEAEEAKGEQQQQKEEEEAKECSNDSLKRSD
uniref:RanBP2-type domain-containing protein n=1 Tax=Globodera pallida TaxID=36090 RepID=A0A183BKE2_GLOPA